MARPDFRIPPQGLLLIAAALVWLVWPSPAFWALLAAYGLAWLALNFGGRRLAVRSLPFSRRAGWVLVALLLAAPLVAALRQREAWVEEEDLRGARQWNADRIRLERSPAIAPPVVFADHPQTLYVHAGEARTAGLRLAGGLPLLEGVSLGHGLFRIDYDPRRDGLPATDSARLDAEVVADGRTIRRRLAYVRPAAHPRWFSSAPEAGLATTVSEETDELFIVSRQGLERRRTVADGPSDSALLAGGRRVAVSHRYSPHLWIVETATGELVHELDLGTFQTRLAVSPDGGRLAVALAGLEPRIEILDTATLRSLARVPLDFVPDWLVFGRSGDELVVSSRTGRALFRLTRRAPSADGGEEGGWEVSEPLHLGRPAVTMARTPEGEVLVATTDYRADGEPHRGNHFIQDQLLTVDVAAWRLTGQLLTARRTPRQSRPGNLDSGLSPMGIAVAADGTRLVAFAGSDEVWRVDPEGLAPPRVTPSAELELIAPHGVADLGDGYWAASSPGGGALAVYSGDGTMAEFVGVSPTDDQLASGGERSLDRLTLTLRAGERAFYEATRSGVSCQSCHLHAATDHSAHDIGQAPLLPTLTVRGVTATAPYLRDGSFPRVRDLDDHLAGGLYRGYRRRDPGRGEALETYVESLPRPVNPRRFADRDLDLERAGADAFVAARCDLCHTFPAFSHLGQHPVRGLFPEYGRGQRPTSQVDTPSLLGTHARHHFLQDGRAHTLEEVLTEHNAANRHGDSGSLSAEQRAALGHFLEAL